MCLFSFVLEWKGFLIKISVANDNNRILCHCRYLSTVVGVKNHISIIFNPSSLIKNVKKPICTHMTAADNFITSSLHKERKELPYSISKQTLMIAWYICQGCTNIFPYRCQYSTGTEIRLLANVMNSETHLCVFCVTQWDQCINLILNMAKISLKPNNNFSGDTQCLK